MPFMATVTWEPAKRDEILKKARTLGVKPLKGVTVLGQWTDLNGDRVFRLAEVDDPKVILLANLAWSDLCKTDAVPVLPLEEAMSLTPSR